MDGGRVYCRTQKGEEEIKTRKFGVSMAVRRILILVDGGASVDHLVQTAPHIGDIPAGLAELERAGFIRVTGTAGAAVLPSQGGDAAIHGVKDALIRVATEILGKDAAKIVEKIRQAPSEREGLLASLQHCKKVVKLTISESKAKLLEQKCGEILGKL